MKYLYQLVMLLCLTSYPFYSQALKGDELKPIQIDADHATVDQKQMKSEFTGNMVITRGTLVVHAARGDASQDKEGGRILNLYGSPVTFEQLADDKEKIEGQANQFTYNSKTNLAVLEGNARVKKGKNIVMGDTLTYNTQTQIYSAISGAKDGVSKKSSGRITVILDQVPDGKK